PVLNLTFGRSCVLDLNDSDIEFTGGSNRQKESFVREYADTKNIAAALKLRVFFATPDPITLDAYWERHGAAGAKSTSHKQPISYYVAQHTTRVITASASKPTLALSQEMRSIISLLGPWSENNSFSRDRYYGFFSSYGTHVVVRLAVGGKLRIARWGGTKAAAASGRRKRRDFGGGMNVPKFAFGGNEKHKRNEEPEDEEVIQVHCEGGSEIAPELTSELKTYVESHRSAGWPNVEIRKKWISAIEMEPAFCPDAEETEYMALFSLGGLTSEQRDSLREAFNSYLMTQHNKQHETPAP
ncbi:hypothetical protein R3P38DRAFT_2390906, partial [Favolaschia claudopus]